jgi:hypothetical protein
MGDSRDATYKRIESRDYLGFLSPYPSPKCTCYIFMQFRREQVMQRAQKTDAVTRVMLSRVL